MRKKVALPTSAHFFLADDVRLESDGKPSLLGFYSDNILVLPLNEGQADPSEDVGIRIDGISIFAVLDIGMGQFKSSIQLLAPSGKVLATSGEGEIAVDSSGTLNFIAKFRPLTVHAFGVFKLLMKVDGAVYEFPFEVKRGVAQGHQAVRPFGNPEAESLQPKATQTGSAQERSTEAKTSRAKPAKAKVAQAKALPVKVVDPKPAPARRKVTPKA